MDISFWKDKKVLVTGHTGFKGSWLCLLLQQIGATVKGFALEPPTKPSLFQESNVAQGMISEIGDIRHYEILYQSIKEFNPQIIFHMAAQSLVRLSYDIPVETYQTNVMGTIHLLEAVRKNKGIKTVVNITSDKCYLNQEWQRSYSEDDPLGGFDPYSNSKACAELVTASYRDSYFNQEDFDKHGCSIASVRAGNVIGGGDWASDRLIPDILRSFKKGEPVKIRNPLAIRPWQHVLEPLSGYLCLAKNLYTFGPEFAESWNFGPDDNDMKSVEFIVERLINKWGSGASWELDDKSNPHETNFLKLDSSKSKTRLGWKPLWTLETSLDRIVNWHKVWLENKDMRSYTLYEIDEYIS